MDLAGKLRLLGVIIVLGALVAAWNALASYSDYRERSERPTEDNTIRRISEQRGLERYESWIKTRTIIRTLLVIVTILIAALWLRG